MRKTILALFLAGATFVTGCGDSNNFDGISGQQGNPQPIVTPTPTTGYFVDAANGSDATGSFNTGAPYATIQAAVANAPTGATITVRPGSYDEPVNLKDGQRVLGVMGGNRPVITAGFVLGSGNTLNFLRFQGVAGNAITGDDQSGGTITNCEIVDTTSVGYGIQARDVDGTWLVEGNTISNLTGLGIEIGASTGDVAVVQINGNTITNCDFNAIGLQASDNGTMRAHVTDNVMTGNQATATFEVIVTDTADFVAQIVGNTNDDVYRLSLLDSPAADLRVERLGQLTSLNSGGATPLVDADPLDPNVPNGAAGFGLATP